MATLPKRRLEQLRLPAIRDNPLGDTRGVTAYPPCRAYRAATGYSVDDLDWLRDDLGIAHIELDSRGSLIVTPATDEHESVVAILNKQGCPPAGAAPWEHQGQWLRLESARRVGLHEGSGPCRPRARLEAHR